MVTKEVRPRVVLADIAGDQTLTLGDFKVTAEKITEQISDRLGGQCRAYTAIIKVKRFERFGSAKTGEHRLRVHAEVDKSNATFARLERWSEQANEWKFFHSLPAAKMKAGVVAGYRPKNAAPFREDEAALLRVFVETMF